MGTWKVASVCILDNSGLDTGAHAICDLATGELLSVNASGTVTYNSDLTYQKAVTLAVSAKVTVPASCLTAGNTCADLQNRYENDSTGASGSCSSSVSACVCLVNSAFMLDESGSYAVSGATLSSMPTGGQSSSDQYCAQGSNELHILELATPMPMGATGMAKIANDLILVRQ